MAPKSWRPDSSLAETVLDSQVANYDFSQSGKVLNSARGQPDTETISYRYSADLDRYATFNKCSISVGLPT